MEMGLGAAAGWAAGRKWSRNAAGRDFPCCLGHGWGLAADRGQALAGLPAVIYSYSPSLACQAYGFNGKYQHLDSRFINEKTLGYYAN